MTHTKEAFFVGGHLRTPAYVIVRERPCAYACRVPSGCLGVIRFLETVVATVGDRGTGSKLAKPSCDVLQYGGWTGWRIMNIYVDRCKLLTQLDGGGETYVMIAPATG